MRGELGAVLGISVVLLPAGVALSTCVVGLPIVSFALGLLIRVLLRSARRVHGVEAPTAASSRRVGSLALGGLLAVLVSMALGASTAAALSVDLAPPVRLGVGLLVAVASALAVGAALAPCAFVPLLVADRGLPVARALPLAFELAARLGPKRPASLGAQAAACIAVPVVVVAALLAGLLVDARDETPIVSSLLLVVPIALSVGPALAVALLSDAYVDWLARGCALSTEHPPARLRTLGLLLLPALALLGVALAVAALTPTRMREIPEEASVHRSSWPESALTASAVTRALPGGRAFARTTDRGVLVEAYDGGGAGAIGAPFSTSHAALWLRDGAPYGGPAGTNAVIVTNGERWAVAVVDTDGVRQDDGLGARVSARLGRPGGLALALGLASLLVLFARLASALGEARALEGPELPPGTAPHAGGLVALHGNVRLASGVQLTVRGARARVHGDASIDADGGALRFRLPSGRDLPWLGAAPEGPVRDGAAILLVSRFEGGATHGLREVHRTWPSDGKLALGSRADAARALVDRATRVAAWMAVPALLALAWAAACLVVGL